MRHWIAASLGFGALLATGVASANDYNETSGDLSNTFSAPTALTVSSGTNNITGTTVTTSGVTDRDYFRITVPAGSVLSSVNLVSFSGTKSFIGIVKGTAFPKDGTTIAAGDLFGYVHFIPSLVGTNILDDMGIGAGAQGFTGSLGPGDYSFWIQETSSTAVNYQVSLVLSPAVPALPAPFGALLGASLGVAGVMLLGRGVKNRVTRSAA
jgi:hypothetical protein